MNKAFFCDRDGIVNQRIIGDYVKKTDEFIFIDDFFPIFSYAVYKNYFPILITNQQGIGKKLMTDNDLLLIHNYMNRVLKEKTNHNFYDILYCGDLSSSPNNRRKPSPTMIIEAANKHNIDLQNSFMIGDSISDIDAGNSAGCKTILVNEKFYAKADYNFSNHNELYLSIPEILI